MSNKVFRSSFNNGNVTRPSDIDQISMHFKTLMSIKYFRFTINEGQISILISQSMARDFEARDSDPFLNKATRRCTFNKVDLQNAKTCWLKGDVCLINCCGGTSREIIVVEFEDPLGQLSFAASCY